MRASDRPFQRLNRSDYRLVRLLPPRRGRLAFRQLSTSLRARESLRLHPSSLTPQGGPRVPPVLPRGRPAGRPSPAAPVTSFECPRNRTGSSIGLEAPHRTNDPAAADYAGAAPRSRASTALPPRLRPDASFRAAPSPPRSGGHIARAPGSG